MKCSGSLAKLPVGAGCLVQLLDGAGHLAKLASTLWCPERSGDFPIYCCRVQRWACQPYLSKVSAKITAGLLCCCVGLCHHICGQKTSICTLLRPHRYTVNVLVLHCNTVNVIGPRSLTVTIFGPHSMSHSHTKIVFGPPTYRLEGIYCVT